MVTVGLVGESSVQRAMTHHPEHLRVNLRGMGVISGFTVQLRIFLAFRLFSQTTATNTERTDKRNEGGSGGYLDAENRMVGGPRWSGEEGQAAIADCCDGGVAEFDFHGLVVTTVSLVENRMRGRGRQIEHKHERRSRGVLWFDSVCTAAIPLHFPEPSSKGIKRGSYKVGCKYGGGRFATGLIGPRRRIGW